MKRLILTLALCLVALPVWAAITEVASQRATSAACVAVDTCALAFPSNVTAGNLIVLGGVVFDDAGTHTFSASDSVGTSYTFIVCTPDLANLGEETVAFLGYGIAGGSGANTVTVNPLRDSSVSDFLFSVDEFTGTHATPLDVNGGSSTGTSTTPADSITTLTANDLVIGIAAYYDGGGSITPGAGYTQIGEDQGSLNAFNFEFQVVTTAQAYSVDWTMSANTEWHACTAAFKVPGAARRAVAPLIFQ